MAPLTLNQIIEALPLLTEQERSFIASALKTLGTEEAKQEPPEQEKELFQALVTELEIVGIRYALGYDHFSKMKAYKMWKAALPSIVLFTEKNFPKLDHLLTLGLYRLLIAELISNMREWGVPISLATVSNNIAKLPEMFESCFPEYMEAGLGHLVIEAIRRV